MHQVQIFHQYSTRLLDILNNHFVMSNLSWVQRFQGHMDANLRLCYPLDKNAPNYSLVVSNHRRRLHQFLPCRKFQPGKNHSRLYFSHRYYRFEYRLDMGTRYLRKILQDSSDLGDIYNHSNCLGRRQLLDRNFQPHRRYIHLHFGVVYQWTSRKSL